MSNPRGILGAVALLAIVSMLAPACSQKTATGAAASGGGGSVGGGVPGGPAAGGGLELSVSVPGLGAKIVKTATVSLQLPRGSFGARVQQAREVAVRNGGFVADSRTTEGDRRSGSLVIRIPAAAFETTLGQVEHLGTVSDEQVGGQDVTARFVDLQARLRNWQAQERVLLGLMNQSKSVTDSLKVQGQLQNVQLQIEEIEGQLRVLNDQTAMSTITLDLTEAGAGATSTATFASAWRWAIRALHASVTGVVVAVGFVLPFALIARDRVAGRPADPRPPRPEPLRPSRDPRPRLPSRVRGGGHGSFVVNPFVGRPGSAGSLHHRVGHSDQGYRPFELATVRGDRRQPIDLPRHGRSVPASVVDVQRFAGE